MDGRPVSDDEGRLVLRGISVAYGLKAKSGRPYSEERNFTIIIGLEAEFRDLVKGKAHKPAAVEPAPCLRGAAAKINVISDSVPSTDSDTLAPLHGSTATPTSANEVQEAARRLDAGLLTGFTIVAVATNWLVARLSVFIESDRHDCRCA